jgi:hypothetical protein
LQYKIELLDTAKLQTEKLQVGSAPYKFSLDNLAPNQAYKLNVIATEKDSEAVFTSPDVIFITAPESTIDSQHVKFIDTNSATNKCKIFVKIKDAFKHTILYR